MAPSDVTTPTNGLGHKRRRRTRSSAIGPNSPKITNDSLQRASRRARPNVSDPKSFNRFYAKTRAGVFVRAGLICAFGFGLLFVDVIAASIMVCFLALALLRPAIAMVIFMPLSAILTSANPVIFGKLDNPAFIQAPLLGLSWAILIYLVLKKRLRPGKTSFVFVGCIAIGGLLALLTTTSIDATFEALWKFAIPLFPLVFWFDNRKHGVCMTKEAPYAFAGLMTSIILGSLIILLTGAGSELNNTDFQGVFWHPQTMGMMMAAAAPSILFARRLPLWLRVLLLIGLVTLTWLSWTRTALAVLTIAGVFAAFMWARDRARIRLSAGLQKPIRIAQVLGLSVIAIGSLIYASILEPQEYSSATAQEIMTQESYANARTFALYRAYENFAAKPATGIGFGVPSDPRLLDKEFETRTIEAFQSGGGGSEVLFDKGNSYLAIFEETGLVGAPIWLGLFVFLVVTISATGVSATIAAIIFAMSILAEATVFSLGGVGMVLWASLFLCAGFGSPDNQRGRGRAHKNSKLDRHKKNIVKQRQLHARGFTPKSEAREADRTTSHNAE